MTRAATTYEPLNAVLVGTDFSEGAAWALERALRLSLAPGATVELIHVLPEEGTRPHGPARAQARRRLDELVAEVRDRVEERALEVRGHLVAGPTHVEIIRRSREAGAELVVLGRHGARTFKELLLGPTAARVVRKGDVPVLVVKLPPGGPYRRPLLATDLQDASNRTLDVCLRVVGPEVRALDVVHGYHVPYEGFVTPIGAADGDYRTSFELEATTRLEALIAGYAWTGARWNRIIRTGDPRVVVLDVALAQATDLIAVGTHGRAGLAHVLIGSVAETILMNAPCDVLVARPVRFQFQPP